MSTRLKPPGRTIARRLSDEVCEGLRQTHTHIGAGFRAMGRFAGRVAAPIPWPARLAVLLVLLGVGLLLVAHGGWRWYARFVYFSSDEFEQKLTALGIIEVFEYYASIARVLGRVTIAAAAAVLVRHRIALYVARVVAALQAAAWVVLGGFLVQFPRLGGALYAKEVGPTGVDLVIEWQTELWLPWLAAWLGVMCLAVVLVVCTWMAGAMSYYQRIVAAEPLFGDRLYDNIRTHGKDPTYRTSLYWPLAACAAYLIILLLMMLSRGCGYEPPYEIPYGSGTPTVKVVQVKRIKRKKPEKLVLNMDSPYIWERPKLTSINVVDEVLDETSEVYVANKNIGRLGAGGGTRGGWPHGVANARVRFVRLRYNGPDWKRNMGHGFDYNMLLYFNKVTGFKIAPNTEYKEIDRLALFRKGTAPPFVYMTGTGRINISSRQVRILRDYCLDEGGMIVADSAGGRFDENFFHMCRQVFGPGKPLVDIPDDDQIYREPFVFPNGAPPLWHHHGRYRPLGIKHEGRWVVFYHPGDMGDAWRTDHSGASQAVASRAYKLGINLIYYAFTRHMEKHHPSK